MARITCGLTGARALMQPLVKRLWEASPKSLQDAIATVVDRAGGIELPSAPTANATAAVRLFIAPANYAGQGYRWARAVEVDPRVSARNMVYAEINPFGYPVDYPVRGRTVTHSREWQRRQLAALTQNFTHVLVEAEMPPLGGLWNQDVRRQVRALQDGGVKVGMVSHGSDIRSPHLHREREAWSPFADDDWVPVDRLEEVVEGNKQLLRDLAVPTFVSTPGLLLDVPEAHLLPVVIDDGVWRTDASVLERRVPVVLHAPSNPLVKGTAQIEPVVRRLAEEGLIDYRPVTGLSQPEMLDLYRSADIVLDQFRLGDYGAAACEAMAAGRLVISHVSDQVRDEVRSVAGVDLPILEGHLDSLDAVLRSVITQPDSARELAAAGPAFVENLHNGERSREVLLHHLMGL